MINEYRAWNIEQEIMVYVNEDDDRDYWDGVNMSRVEMVNARLKLDKDYIWMSQVYKKENGQVFYDGDILEHPNGKQRFYITKGTYSIGYVLNDCKTEMYHCTLNIDHFKKLKKIGNIYEDKHLMG